MGVPSFCRHNRFVERCPVCAPTVAAERPSSSRNGGTTAARARSGAAKASPRASANTGLRVRRESRAADDGFRSPLVPGVRATADAERLAGETAFGVARLGALATDPPDLYARARADPDREQALWTVFLAVYVGPRDERDPFAAIAGRVTDWHSGELPDLAGVALGPRTSHDPARGSATLLAYRAWADRAGSQQAALEGDPSWSAERRFTRVFERLALPGLGRPGRFDLLVTLGCLGLLELRAESLQLVEDDATTLAAKRVFGIGDRMNLERRVLALARAGEVPLDALDLALANWAAPVRSSGGVSADLEEPVARERMLVALGL